MQKGNPMYRLVASTIALLFVLAACASHTSNSRPTTPASTQNPLATATNAISTINFTTSGGLTGSYTIANTATLSKLRHGHKEFTIDLANADQSIFLVFYGYNGPGAYTLTNSINGGDVRIDLGKDRGAWDLALLTHASCSLTISSDTPTQDEGLDSMTGNFSCPLLPASSPNQTRQPITITHGQFAIFIIVES